MKKLTCHLFEKLIINKHLNTSNLDNLFDIKFIRDDISELKTNEKGVIEIVHEFIKSNNIRKLSSRMEMVKLNSSKHNFDYDKYFACINIYTNEVIIFHKYEENKYDKYSIWYKLSQSTNDFLYCMFVHYKDEWEAGIYPLREYTTFSDDGRGELYQISKETYNEIKETFNKIYKG